MEETRKEFSNSIHVKVGNAGHEQAMWHRATFNETIPAFLLGKEISIENPSYAKLKFLPLEGEATGHPSWR